MTWWVPALAAVFGGVFAAAVAARARGTRRASDALWAAGLLAYALASALEARAEVHGWSVLRYRLYFALAPALVGLLGAGTGYVLADRHGRRAWAGGFAALVGVLLAVAGLAQLDIPLSGRTLVEGPSGARPLAAWGADVGARAVPFPHPARWAFLLANVLGGLVLVGGAAWTGIRDRDGAMGAIAVGALLPLAGGVVSTAGAPELRLPLQLAGVVVMFAGYVASVGGPPRAGVLGGSTDPPT